MDVKNVNMYKYVYVKNGVMVNIHQNVALQIRIMLPFATMNK